MISYSISTYTSILVAVLTRLTITVLQVCLALVSPHSNAVDVLPSSENYPRSYLSDPNPLLHKTQNFVVFEMDAPSSMMKRVYSSSYSVTHKKAGLVGYFNSRLQYRYHSKKRYFEEDSSLKRGEPGAWDGRFLNWLAMRKIDMARYLLLGTENTLTHDSQKIIELDRSAFSVIKISDINSRLYSPIPNGENIFIERGTLKFKNKKYALRVKAKLSERGFIDILSPAAQVYFFAEGDATSSNKPSSKKVVVGNKNQFIQYLIDGHNSTKHQTKIVTLKGSSDGLAVALDQIQKLYNKQNKPKKLDEMCQRYVHINLQGDNRYLTENMLNMDDCQPDIKGLQALKSFNWNLSGSGFSYKQTLVNQHEISSEQLSTQKQFNIDEMFDLAKYIFGFLYSKEGNSFQVSGGDIDYFPDGTGVLYQALSQYKKNNNHDEVHWSGDLVALFIDEQGRIRSDNGDKKLGALSEDPVLSSCFDETDKIQRYRKLTLPGKEARCNRLNYPYLEHEVGYLWRASEQLNRQTQGVIYGQEQSFNGRSYKRYIRTHIAQTEYDFIYGSSYPLELDWLNVNTHSQASQVINYIRGDNQLADTVKTNSKNKKTVELRNRSLGGKSYVLGDSTFSDPVVVGAPQSNFHLLYNDQSYLTFLNKYRKRRSRVFLASNDGMLHSFNAGIYAEQDQQLMHAEGSKNDWFLGQETWAFVPFSVLPYLSELQNKYYGISPSHHINLLTQTPYIFDAKVFDEGGIAGQLGRDTHPGGWGTLMVVGMGLGGGDYKINKSGKLASTKFSFSPSYLIFDITDAEQAPRLLASVQHENMGSSSSLPSAITLKNSAGELEWQLVFGSGTDLDPLAMQKGVSTQSAKLFLLNLHTLTSNRVRPKLLQLELGDAESYISGISAADWNLDGETDSVYVNSSSRLSLEQSPDLWGGSIYRLNLSESKAVTEKIFEHDAPFINRPILSIDPNNNRWIYASSGPSHISEHDERFPKSSILGIKEARNAQGIHSDKSTPSYKQHKPINSRSLVDVTNLKLGAESGTIRGGISINPPLEEQSLTALEKRLMQYSDPSKYHHGWIRKFDKNEAPGKQSILLSGMLTQATYRFEYLACELSGEAYLHRLRYTTGTPWVAQKNTHKVPQNTEHLNDTRGELLGAEPVSTVLVHKYLDQVQQIPVLKNGKTKLIQDKEAHVLKSGEITWRAL